MEKKQRLDRFLANMQVGARRQVKALIRSNRVTVNGVVINKADHGVFPEQALVAVDGQPVEYKKFFYIMLNKPKGYLSATKDRNAPTVLDLLPEKWRVRDLAPVGRLDKDTEGLLLFTNDGPLSHRLLAPRFRVAKTYFLRVEGEITLPDLKTLEEGVILEDGYRTLPAKVRLLRAGEISELELTIYEGKFHQVKRMLKAVGKEVVYLQRKSMGALTLDPGLALGESRELSAEEIQRLKSS